MLKTMVSVLCLFENWFIFAKMGIAGWLAFLPPIGLYALFEKLYGNGWKFLYLLIPIYGICVWVKLNTDLAHGFNKSTNFGIGMAIIYPLFAGILAFGNEQYGDGSEALHIGDFHSGIDYMTSKIDNLFHTEETSYGILNDIEKLEKLHEDGVISDEDYEIKKEELISRL